MFNLCYCTLKNLMMCSLFIFCASASAKWTAVAPGIQYNSISPYPQDSQASLILLRINPKDYTLSLALSNQAGLKTNYVNQLAKENQALIGINGGFFSPSLTPLGLRINHYKTLSPLKKISWWGVFMIKNKQAQIVSSREFHANTNIEFAVQAGPRLLVNGSIPSLKPGLDQRSALCVTKNKHIIIAATNHLAMSTTTLAKWLSRPEIGCRDALNLDGGTSTQLYASIGRFQRHVSSLRAVTDAILVHHKSSS